MAKALKKSDGISKERVAWAIAEADAVTEQMAAAQAKVTQEQVDKAFRPYKAPDGVRGADHGGMVGDTATLPAAYAPSAGVVGAYPTLAQMAQEGIGFPGYPYLSTLSMRGEYRNIVGVRAREFFRKWGRFVSKSGDNEGVKAKVDRLAELIEEYEIPDLLRHCFEHDEYFGIGSIITVMDGDDDDRAEMKTPLALDREKVGNAKVARFQLVEPVWMTPDQYDSADPLSPTFYRPQTWWVMGTRVHISRIAQIISRPMPDLLKPAFNFGGLPLTLMAKPYVDNWLRTRQNVADIIDSMRIFVVTTNIPDQLDSGIKGRGSRGLTLKQRLKTFVATMSNFGVLALSNGETFDQKTTSLAELADLKIQSLQDICSIVNIPVLKYTTNQPTGLSDGNDEVMRAFYDTAAAVRINDIQPALMQMTDILQVCEWGEVDPDLVWKWDDLDEPTPKERLDMEESKARIRASDAAIGAITGDEAREQIRGDEDSIYAASGVTLEGSAPDLSDYEGGDPSADELTSGDLALPPEKLTKPREG